MKGIKYDQGKPRYELLPVEPIEELVKVLTHGAIKYKENNWRYVEPFQDRYYGAAFRHLQKWRLGKIVDEDSGYHHLGSALCCILFLLCRDLENETEEEKNRREIIQEEVNEKYAKLKKE